MVEYVGVIDIVLMDHAKMFDVGHSYLRVRQESVVDMIVREATEADASAMSRVLRAILDSWKSDRPSTPEHVLENYVKHRHSLRCTVAIDFDENLLGFQSLRRAWAANPYDVPEGWGIIGTYVDDSARGRGVGRALFDYTLEAARNANLAEIDATIGASNAGGLAYYEAMGFRSYRSKLGADCKKLSLK